MGFSSATVALLSFTFLSVQVSSMAIGDIKPNTIAQNSTIITLPVIQGGSLDRAALASVSANLPKPGATLAATPKMREYATEKRQNGNGAFLATSLGDFTYDCQFPFTVNGPFKNIRATSDTGFGGLSSNSVISGLSVTDMFGNFNHYGALSTGAGDTGTFVFADGETISSFNLYSANVDNSQSPIGFSFTTSNSNTVQTASNTGDSTAVKLGSGYIASIRGCVDSHQFINSIEFDMLDDLENILITNIDYSTFADNIAPAGQAQTINVGSQVLDNTNSSVSQSTTYTTISTVSSTQLVQTDSTVLVGGSTSVAIEEEVDIPLIEKSKVTVTAEANWSLSKTSTVQDSNTQTKTSSETIPLICPAYKYCTETAFIQQWSLKVHIIATYTATTKIGATFQWQEQGTYVGQDSTSVTSQPKEYDLAPSH